MLDFTTDGNVAVEATAVLIEKHYGAKRMVPCSHLQFLYKCVSSLQQLGCTNIDMHCAIMCYGILDNTECTLEELQSTLTPEALYLADEMTFITYETPVNVKSIRCADLMVLKLVWAVCMIEVYTSHDITRQEQMNVLLPYTKLELTLKLNFFRYFNIKYKSDTRTMLTDIVKDVGSCN